MKLKKALTCLSTKSWQLTLAALLVSGSFFGRPTIAKAASGEMGSGVPGFGSYSAATGVGTAVWTLANPTINFPSGCGYIVLLPATMGLDAYKIAIATMISARIAGKHVRFYAHSERDGGCGVDYVEMK